MTIPDAAIEAAAEATCHDPVPCGPCKHQARITIEAAIPAIREHIAQDIEAECYRTEGFSAGTYYDGVDDAARIVRGGAA